MLFDHRCLFVPTVFVNDSDGTNKRIDAFSSVLELKLVIHSSKEMNMYRGLLALAVVLFLFLMSCDSVSPEDKENFAIEFTLTNSEGVSLSGYRVSIVQKDWNNLLPGATKYSTSFECVVKDSYRVQISITDYFNNPVRSIHNATLIPGAHRFNWNKLNDNNELVRDGIYRIKVNYYTQTDSLAFTDSCLAYLLSEFNADLSPYVTNASGMFVSHDVLPFPVLYCQEPVPCKDESGNIIDEIDFSATSDSMLVIVTSPYGESRSHYFRLHNGKNVLNLNWDTLTGYDKNIPKQTKKNINLSNPKMTISELISFSCNLTADNRVIIKWAFAFQDSVLGFRLYRNETNNLPGSIIISPTIPPAPQGTTEQWYEFYDNEVIAGTEYYYWLEVIGTEESNFYGPGFIQVPDTPHLPTVNRFLSNYPNPFN
jgi:hypothetical protein